MAKKMGRGRPRQSLEESFEKYVVRAEGNECWKWTGIKAYNGYGRMWDNKSQRLIRAHRWIYEKTFGRIPEGMVVMHTCNNPECCNPLHLKIGTQQENLKQRDRQWRLNHKLTIDEIKEIRIMLANRTKQKFIAEVFKVAQGTISSIKLGKSWKNV